MVRYCQNCGAILSKREIEGHIRDVCDSCGAIYYDQWKVSAGVCAVKDGKLLLIQRGIDPWKGCWHMPAGYVEIDEDPSAAAVRECLEETGLVVKTGGQVKLYTDYEDPRGNVLVLIYNGKITSGELAITAETTDCGFFSPEAISSLSLAGMSARKSISAWVEHPGMQYE